MKADALLTALAPTTGYGNLDIFRKRLAEGYTEASFGSGEWVGDYRIVRLWVFSKPEPGSDIATYEHPKACEFGQNHHGQPFEATYSATEFDLYIKKWQIGLGRKTSLAKIVEDWPNN